jgi:hypothetical protein
MRFRVTYFIASLFILWSCTPCTHCASINNYIKVVDLSKPYIIEGKYCIASSGDTVLKNDDAIIKINLFDRRNGQQLREGVAWFYNETDTIKLFLDQSNGFKEISAGKYVIGISVFNNGLLGFQTNKKIDLHKNSKTEVNIFLGSSLQW